MTGETQMQSNGVGVIDDDVENGKPPSQSSDGPTRTRAPHGIARAKILIIEDARTVHHLVKTHLADEAYDILSAFDGTSGLAMAKRARVDLVLLDLDLPDFNGFEVCRELKADPATADIAVIFLTASTGLDEKEIGLGLEASDYVTKPFDPRELSVRIRTALRVKRLLDLLPHDQRDGAPRPSATNEGGCESHLSMRLSLPKVIHARRMNPWGRIRPGSAA